MPASAWWKRLQRVLRTGLLLGLAAWTLQGTFAQDNEGEGDDNEEAPPPPWESPDSQVAPPFDAPPLPEDAQASEGAEQEAGQESMTPEQRRQAKQAEIEQRRQAKLAAKEARAEAKVERKQRKKAEKERKRRQKEEEALSKPARLVKFDPEIQIKHVWSAGIGGGLSKHFGRIAPAILADRVFIADAYGLVEARNRFDGSRLWQARVGKKKRVRILATSDRSSLTGGVGAGEGMVLIGTTRGEVIALDVGDGSELWRVVLSSEILAPPVAGDGVVVAHTGDGRIVALEPTDGSTRWTYDIQVPILSLRGTATPKIMGGRVYAAFSTGTMAAIDVESGAPVWEQRIMLPEGRSELERIVDIDGTPVILADATFAASYQGQLKAMHTANGTVAWERQASTHLDLAVGYAQVYVVSEDDIIMAVNQTDSSTAWEYEGLRNRRLTSPLTFGNYVLVGDGKGYLHALAQSDGRPVGRLKLGGGLRSNLVEVDDILYVFSNKGRLHALEIQRIE